MFFHCYHLETYLRTAINYEFYGTGKNDAVVFSPGG